MRTLGSFFLALQQQAQGESLPGSSSFSLIEIIAEASPIQKAVLIVLALFYSGTLNVAYLGAAAVVVGALALLNRSRVYRVTPYLLLEPDCRLE